FARTAPTPGAVINMTAHVVQAPGPLLRLLASAPTSKVDQTEDLQRLLQEASEPGSPVKILHTGHLRAGQREATLSSGTERTFVADVRLDAAGRASVIPGQRLLGFTLKVDAAAYPQHQSVSLDIASTLTFLRKKPRLQTATEPVTGSLQKWEVPEFQEAALQTSLSLINGQTRLIAQWPAKGDSQLRKDDVAQGLFITAHLAQLAQQPEPDPHRPAFPEDANTPADWSTQLPPGLIYSLRSEAYKQYKSPFAQNAKKRLADYGLQVPEDTRLSLDETGKLQVTATAEVLAGVYQWALSLKQDTQPSLTLRLETYRAPAAQVRPLLAESARQTSHQHAHNVLKEAVARGEARLTGFMQAEGKIGGTLVGESGLDHRYLSGITWSKPAQPSLQTKTRFSGLRMKAESTAEEGDQHIFLDYKLEHHTSLPYTAGDVLADPASKRSFRSPRDDFHVCTLDSSGLFTPHVPHIIGIWQPVGENGQPVEGELEITFLTCEILPRLGPPPAPESPPFFTVRLLPVDGDGMATATFNVGPGFLSMNAAPVEERVTGQKDVPVSQRFTAQDLLEGQGIVFPPGAKASYTYDSGILTVRNTPANLELVELFVRDCSRPPPKTLNFHLHLFEAQAENLQELTRQQASAEDHTPVLTALLDWTKAGKATAVATLAISTQGGLQREVRHTQDHPTLVSIGLDKNGGSEIKREIVRSGTWMELDPVLDAAGLTSDLNITLENHPALPVHREENLAVEGDPPVIIPLTDFYRDKITSRLTLSSGTSRIVALWKPAGKPGDVLHIAILQMNTTSAE
ncbi:MAG TPA: hypothetical protein VGE29_00225, partial [Prosthecobacter sp.]